MPWKAQATGTWPRRLVTNQKLQKLEDFTRGEKEESVEAPSLADLIDEDEVSHLLAQYGPGQRWQVARDVPADFFEEWWERLVVRPNRRGEVVLAIQRPDGNVLLHTKPFYPEGVFRLPSGGVHPGEPVLTWAIREAREETGLEVGIGRFLGMVEYTFRHAGRQMAFVSYVLLMPAGDDPPAAQDTKERISGFRYVAIPELRTIAAQLRGLPAPWSDWGHFRAPPHDLAADML